LNRQINGTFAGKLCSLLSRTQHRTVQFTTSALYEYFPTPGPWSHVRLIKE